MKTYSISELVEGTGVPQRTVRFYIAEGLLDPPLTGGRGARYTDDHGQRLAQIMKLKASGRTLDEVREQLGLEMAPAQRSLGAFAEGFGRRTPRGRSREIQDQVAHYRAAFVPALRADPPGNRGHMPSVDQWTRVTVAPGIELHTRGQRPRTVRRLIAALQEVLDAERSSERQQSRSDRPGGRERDEQ